MAKADELKGILEAGDTDAVARFFRGMPEPERRTYAAQCAAWHKEIRKNPFVQTAASTWSSNRQGPAVYLAFFCTATFSELCKAPRWALPHGSAAFEALADRRPAWLEPWALRLLDEERYWQNWRLVRRMVREGLIPKPDHPNYALGMISGINSFDEKKATIKERLDEDLELLDDEVWRLFEYEGGGENSLANTASGGSVWIRALLDYVEAGKLSRDRLLTCSIQALRRDFNHYRAKWFAAFHDALTPTDDEMRANAAHFLALLAASAPNIVAWAFTKVEAQADAYAAPELISGLRPALEARSKGLVKKALKLIGKVAQGRTELHPSAATAATVALGHAATDVQAAALDLVERLSRTGEPPAVLGDYRTLVAPSLRSRLEALISASAPPLAPAVARAPAPAGPMPAPTPDAPVLPPHLRDLFGIEELRTPARDGVLRLPAATFDGTDLRRLAGHEPIAPVNDLDELIDLCARVLEDAVGPDDIERTLDGMSRLCDQRPGDFERRTGPLLKRSKQLMKRDHTPFAGVGPVADLAGLVHAWITGEVTTVAVVDAPHNHQRVAVTIGGETLSIWAGNHDRTVGALSRRVHTLSLRVAARAATPLLGAPTHSGCLIDPVVLAERANGWQGPPPAAIEVVLALLRLVPERRGEALQLLAASQDEWRRAIRHALGGTTPIGEAVALWAAAARARAPWARDVAVAQAFPDSGPDVGEAARYDVSFAPNQYGQIRAVFPPELAARGTDHDCIPVVLHTERGDGMWELGGLGGRSDSAVRWTASAWPIARESFFAAALVQIIGNLDWWEARWYSKTLLEPLLDPATPLREMGLMLLVTALAAKEPGEHGLATDAAIAAIEDGRLGSDNLGRMLARMLASGLIKAARWSNTLAEVARASEAHALVVKLALAQCLTLIDEPPRDFVKLLELLKELCVQLNHGVALDQRAPLEALKGSSKLAKAAKALVSVPVDARDARITAAVSQLTEMRLRAAARWV